MKKSFGFRQLSLPRPVFLVDDSVEVDLEKNVITAKALFPSSDPSLGDRKDGHVNLQHFDAVGSNLFHTLIAAKGEGPKTVRVVRISGADFIREVRQDTEIDVTLGYITTPARHLRDGTPVYKGSFTGRMNGQELFNYQYDVVIK